MAVEGARRSVSRRLDHLEGVLAKVHGALDFISGDGARITETVHSDPRLGNIPIANLVLYTESGKRVISPRLVVGEGHQAQVVNRLPFQGEPDKIVYFVRAVGTGRKVAQAPIEAATAHAPFSDEDLIRAAITSFETAKRIEITHQEVPVVNRKAEADNAVLSAK